MILPGKLSQMIILQSIVMRCISIALKPQNIGRQKRSD
jgi:hypothetical protein